MNTFLHGCCFIPPEDDTISTPSFSNYSPHSVASSRPSSKTSYDIRSLGSKEIFYIKKFPIEAWADFDDERSLNSSTSLQVFTGSNRSSSSIEYYQRKVHSSRKILLTFHEEDNERMSFWLCGANNEEESKDNGYYVPSSCKPKSSKKLITSTSRVLDFISTCFWRCSPGCQQIPTIA